MLKEIAKEFMMLSWAGKWELLKLVFMAYADIAAGVGMFAFILLYVYTGGLN